MSDEALRRIEGKIDTIGDSVNNLNIEVAGLKTTVSQMPKNIDAAINKHTLDCINRKVKEKIDAPMSPKLIASLVGAVVALAGGLVALVKGLF